MGRPAARPLRLAFAQYAAERLAPKVRCSGVQRDSWHWELDTGGVNVLLTENILVSGERSASNMLEAWSCSARGGPGPKVLSLVWQPGQPPSITEIRSGDWMQALGFTDALTYRSSEYPPFILIDERQRIDMSGKRKMKSAPPAIPRTSGSGPNFKPFWSALPDTPAHSDQRVFDASARRLAVSPDCQRSNHLVAPQHGSAHLLGKLVSDGARSTNYRRFSKSEPALGKTHSLALREGSCASPRLRDKSGMKQAFAVFMDEALVSACLRFNMQKRRP